MSIEVKTTERMVDYVHQLRRHVKGRRAVHIRLSSLERYFREEHYRLFCASALHVLVKRFGATMFTLPNADIVVATLGARVDDIGPPIAHIRKKFREAALVASLDPIQGVSDAFVEWFDLEQDYERFRNYIEQLASVQGTPVEPAKVEKASFDESDDEPLEAGLSSGDNNDVPFLPRAKPRMVPITPVKLAIDDRELNPELLLTLTKALHGADISSFLRKQSVKAVIGTEPAMPVFIHKQVPLSLLFEALLKGKIITSNRWLGGYLEDFVAERVLYSTPNMINDTSLATSLKLTLSSLFSEAFEVFDRSLDPHPRSKIILEFSVLDMLANAQMSHAAMERVKEKGYKVCVAGLDMASFLWLDHSLFNPAFIKVGKPEGELRAWLTRERKMALSSKIDHIGMARIILDGCNSKEDIVLGQKLGFSLFQGDAIDPLSTT